MANTYAPFGLQSCDTIVSAVWNNKLNQSYQISPTDPNPIYQGDPVVVVNGYITLYTATMQTAGLIVPLGVFRGCRYNQIGTGYNVPFFQAWLGINDVVAGSPVYADVEDDISLIFKVQSNEALGVQIGSTYKNAQLALPAAQPAPSANTSNQSVVGLQAAVAGNAAYDMKVIGVFDAANGGAYNASPTLNSWSTSTSICPYPILLVQWNNQLTRAGTPGAA